MPHIVIILIIGAIAGWIAGAIVQEDSNSFLLDILIGIVGGWLGYRLFGHKLSITDSRLINEIITATVGAAILALGLKILRRIFR